MIVKISLLMAVSWTCYPHNWRCQRALSPHLTPVSLLRIPKHGIGSRCVFSGTCQLSPTKLRHRGLSHIVMDGYRKNQVSIHRTSSIKFAFEQLFELLSSHPLWHGGTSSCTLLLVSNVPLATTREGCLSKRGRYLFSCKFLDSLSFWDSFFCWSMPRGGCCLFLFYVQKSAFLRRPL